MEQRLRGAPHVFRADILHLAAQTQGTLRPDEQYANDGRSQFTKIGATLALGAAEDHLVGGELRRI